MLTTISILHKYITKLRLASRMSFSQNMILSNLLTIIKILQRSLEPLMKVANHVADVKNISHLFQ